MDISSLKEVQLTNSDADDLWPGWSPDGDRIAFVSKRDGNQELYLMESDGSAQLRLTFTETDEEDPSWSPDGQRIVYASFQDGQEEIYSINISDLTEQRLTRSPGMDALPSWSPDGNQILFVSNRDGNPEIYVMNTDGTQQRRLTRHPSSDGLDSLVWSPIISGGPCGKEKTGSSDAPRTPAQPLAKPEGCFSTRIAFVSERDGNREIYLMNEDGTEKRNLTQNPAMDDGPMWSPDGRNIAFISDRDGDLEIYVISPPSLNPSPLGGEGGAGGALRRLTDTPGSDLWPVWSSDGSQLAFISERNGNPEVYVMQSDGTRQQRMTHTLAQEKWVSWQP